MAWAVGCHCRLFAHGEVFGAQSNDRFEIVGAHNRSFRSLTYQWLVKMARGSWVQWIDWDLCPAPKVRSAEKYPILKKKMSALTTDKLAMGYLIARLKFACVIFYYLLKQSCLRFDITNDTYIPVQVIIEVLFLVPIQHALACNNAMRLEARFRHVESARRRFTIISATMKMPSADICQRKPCGAACVRNSTRAIW